MNPRQHRRTTNLRRGFTMLELMVVAAIFVLLLTLAIPAFSNLLYSSEQSLAENSLRMGLSAARDGAARGAQGDDAVAAFFYDPATGYTIVPYTRAGVIVDDFPPGSSRPPGMHPPLREVFVPIAGYEPVYLPRGWMIRGYAAPHALTDAWYGDSGTPYASTAVRSRGQWLFPETSFYLQNNDLASPAQADAGRKRQTFMLRFQGGTGALLPVDNREVLLLAPAPTQSFRGQAPFNSNNGAWRADLEGDGMRLVRRILASTLSDADKRRLLGDISTDTVLAKPVAHIAMCNERALANALSRTFAGTRVDSSTGSLYRRVDRPELIPANADPVQFLNGPNGLNAWIENRINQADSDARIFTVHRYLGTLQEVSGTMGVN